MITGGLLGAFGAYLFQVVGGRALGPAAFAPIGVLWTVLFILITVVLVPLEQYVTREASRGRRVLVEDRNVIASVGMGAAVVGAAFVLTSRGLIFGGDPIYALHLGLALLGYTAFLSAKGILAGHRLFRGVGWVLIGEAAARLAAALVILAFVRTAPALAWALVIAPLAALATRFWRHDREATRAEKTAPAGFLGAYITGSAASQLLLAGAPLAVAFLGGSPELVSVVFVTFTLYRGPLTLIYALQGRILPFLVRMAEENGSGLRRLAAGILVGGAALGLVGGVVGWLVGPEVVALLYGEAFGPGRAVAAMAAGGVMAGSTAQVAGQALVARGHTGRLASAWILGLVVGLAVLVFDGSAPDRTVASAFLAGEAAAMVAVAVLTLRGRR